MLRFISFGSGSSGNCYLLYTATDGLLIDSGIGTRLLKKHLKDYGLNLKDIHNIIVTHDHADHVKAVGCVSHETNVPVYATREVHAGIRRNYCVRKKVDESLVRYVEKGCQTTIGEFSVTPFAVPHDSADNVGYRIEHDGVVFCLVTDAGEVTPDIKKGIAEADYLVIEANHDVQMLEAGNYPPYLKSRIRSGTGHLSNEECGKALAENLTDRLKHVWLCHLSEENNHPELARKTVEDILLRNGIRTGDGLKLEVLKRKSPSEIHELV